MSSNRKPSFSSGNRPKLTKSGSSPSSNNGRPSMFSAMSSGNTVQAKSSAPVKRVAAVIPMVYSASGKPTVVATSSGLTLNVPKRQPSEPEEEKELRESEVKKEEKSEETEERPSSPVKPTSRTRRAPRIDSDSEAETDIEDSIPLPSRVGRRLMRKLDHERSRSSGRDFSESETDSNRSKSLDVKKRESKASRSSSPNRMNRKVSKGGRDSGGRSRLQRACEKGKYEEVVELIEAGADVNDSDNAGTTCLQEAALNGHVEIAKLLLDNGADVDKQSGPFDKDTALIDAASNNHLEIVKLLIERGADPLITNVAGQTAYDAVEEDDDEAQEIRKCLVEATRKFRELNKIHEPEENPRPPLNTRRDPLWVDFTTKQGREEIFQRSAAGDEAFVGNYLSNGGRPHTEALSAAALHGHTDIASLLLAFGAKVDSPNSEGVTPLMFTVGRGHRKTVDLLLSNGANPTRVDQRGRSVLDAAIQGPLADDEEIELIREAIRNWSGPVGEAADSKKRKASSSKSKYKETKPEPKLDEERKIKKKKVKITESHEEVKRKEYKSPVVTPKKERSREPTPISPPQPVPELTPEEEEAKKAKEREAQRQREAYELQRQERIKAKQMQIMSSITQSERRREEERKKAEIMEKKRLESQKEEELRKAKEAEEQEKRKQLKKEIDKKKVIRSLYPEGLATATFGTRTESDALRYLPLYVVNFEEQRWCLDIQVNLVLGVERLYRRFPDWEKVPVTDDQKIKMWKFLSPMLGTKATSEDPQAIMHEDENKFLMLLLNWVKLDKVNEAVSSEFPEVAKALSRVGICEIALADLAAPDTSSSLTSVLTPSDASELLSTKPIDYARVPRAFRGRAKAAGILNNREDLFSTNP